MKPSTLFLLLVSVVSIGLGACANNTLTSSDPNPQDTLPEQPKDSVPVQHLDTSVIMPLKVGNRWIGRAQEMDSAGTILKTTYDTTEIVERDFIYGEWWYRDNNRYLYTNRSDGLWELAGPVTPQYSWRIKYPVSVNDEFTVDSVGYSILPDRVVLDTYHVVDVGTDVNVPAGTFRSVRYRIDTHLEDGSPYERGARFEVYAPGIGSIQGLVYGYKPDRKMYLWYRWDLIDVDLK